MKSIVKFLAAVAALAALASPVSAGSVAVGKKLEINVDPNKMDEEKADLWKKFGGWCAIKDWHPAIAACEESKEGDTQFRTLTLKDGGGKIKEKLLEMTLGRYKYEIIESPLPVKNYQAQFALTPDDDDLDEINFAWSATFDPEGKTDKEARAVIDGIFKAGLDNIKKLAGGDKDKD
ncbi:MAG: SRPBCC family protein [Hyphomicrobium sp.]